MGTCEEASASVFAFIGALETEIAPINGYLLISP